MNSNPKNRTSKNAKVASKAPKALKIIQGIRRRSIKDQNVAKGQKLTSIICMDILGMHYLNLRVPRTLTRRMKL